jgi:serine/threonine-protein kinase RsbT
MCPGVNMALVSAEVLPLTTSDHIVIVRQAVRQRAVDLGFSLVDQTKIVTAASELARNTIQHGGGGRATIEAVTDGSRRGLRLTVEDDGPGIADIELAMRDGYSSAGGLGLGLSGSKRLSNEFSIASSNGKGTRVIITRWK